MKHIWNLIKSGFKLFLFFIVLIPSILMLSIRLLITPAERQQSVKFQARKRFCRRSNTIFGVKVTVVGRIPRNDTFLYVSNHRSFYDPVALLSRIIANPVSKAEVSKYPVIGWGTRLTEVMMLDRHAAEDRQRMKHRIYEALTEETNVLIFPEGTTTDAMLTARFKKGAFDSAVRADTGAVPIAVEYPDPSYYWLEKPLFEQFLYHLAEQKNRAVYLYVGEPVFDKNPILLMEKCKATIDHQIQELRRLRLKNGT